MNAAAYAAALGKDLDDEEYGKQFKVYFEMVVYIETILLKSYEKSIKHLEQQK